MGIRAIADSTMKQTAAIAVRVEPATPLVATNERAIFFVTGLDL